jgi:hypothetical protein
MTTSPKSQYHSTIDGRPLRKHYYEHEPDEVVQLREHLHNQNLKSWGFVIYRCTYDDDVKWEKFIKHFKDEVHDSLKNTFKTPDLLETLTWTVKEDRELFEGATIAQLRKIGRQWVTSKEVDEEIEEAVFYRLGLNIPYKPLSASEKTIDRRIDLSPRYKYCISIDSASLNGTLNHLHNTSGYKGHVNVINLGWELPDPNDPEYANAEEEGYNPIDEGEPPIEGVRTWDVGWMRCSLDYVMPTFYSFLAEHGVWEERGYRRPPEVADDCISAVQAPKDVPSPLDK